MKLQSYELVGAGIEKFPTALSIVLTATAGWLVTVWNKLPLQNYSRCKLSHDFALSVKDRKGVIRVCLARLSKAKRKTS